jgi:hypothetical protein
MSGASDAPTNEVFVVFDTEGTGKVSLMMLRAFRKELKGHKTTITTLAYATRGRGSLRSTLRSSR